MKNKHFICCMVIVMAAAFLINLSVTLMTVRDNTIKDEQRVCGLVSEAVLDSIDSEISRLISVSETLSTNSLFIDMLKDEGNHSEEEMVGMMKKYLSGIKDNVGVDTAFAVSENSRRYYTHEGLNKIVDPDNNDHDIWYSIFVNGRKDYDIYIDTDEVNGCTWTVFVNIRVEDENRNLLGVCGVGLVMNDVQETIKEYEEKYNVKVNLVDSEGNVQVDTNSINIDNARLYDVQYGKEKDGYRYFDNGDYVIMRYFEKINWYLVIRRTINNNSDTTLKITLCFICTALVSIIVFLSGTVFRKKTEHKE